MTETYIAYKMDSQYIYWKCPYCFRCKHKIIQNPYTKLGNKYQDLKNGYHIYNSYNDFSNRIISIKNHCLYSPHRDIDLIVNDKTLKIKY